MGHSPVRTVLQIFCCFVLTIFIPLLRSQTADVLRALRASIEASAAGDRPLYVHFPVEVRFARPSDIYLSPSYGRDTTYINIICYRPYRKFVDHAHWWEVYEAAVKRAGGRPHWAKVSV